MPFIADIPITNNYLPRRRNIEYVITTNNSHFNALMEREWSPYNTISLSDFLIEPVISPVKSNTNATLLSIDDFNKYDNNLSEFYISNITKITKAFYKELKRVETLYLVNEDIIRKDFNTISKQISTLPFEVCSIEITSDNSIKFTLIFPENRVVMVTKITNKDYDFGKDDIIYSYFINRNLIASDVTPIQSFTENFKGYILQELV
jgi:hypothetical protein